MVWINTLLGIPLGYVMYFCNGITRNYGFAIILFTFLVKLILFPISIVQQKNSVKLARLQPKLDEIKRRYAGDRDTIAEEQIALYKKEKYSPFFALLPLLLQIPLILGLIDVIYKPLQHLLHLSETLVAAFSQVTERSLGVTLGWAGQLQVIDAVRSNPTLFQGIPQAAEVCSSIESLNLEFLGLNLSQIPGASGLDPILTIPLLSGLSALLLCVMQNNIDILQKRQPTYVKYLTTVLMIAISAYFAFVVPAGVGLYWTTGNILSIGVLILCNRLYTVVDMGRHTQKARLSKDERRRQRDRKKANRLREKADGRRFYSDENESKQLVFYSQASGFYKYFKGVIEYVANHSDIVVHYVTSDPNDRIFSAENRQIIPYYIGEHALIPFMMKMDAEMVVMTMPDLGQFHIKRSLVRKDVEYVYLDHGFGSYHLMLREGALDHYDTIFCYGPNHVEEIRETERSYGLPAKKLVHTGFCLLDEMLGNVSAMEQGERFPRQILIAPSWQVDNILELCIDETIAQLVGKEFRVIVRPHPEFTKRFPDKMQEIIDAYRDRLDENFIIQTDFSSNETVFQSDLVVTDWSSIAQEFSYATKKPTLFINTPMKVMNPEYKRIPCIPLEISLRDKIGVSVDVDKLDTLYDAAKYLIEHREEYREKITDVLNRSIFNIGHSDKVAGEYIIKTLRRF